jgi:diguanylate cyclase (GGDEF)-like protein
VNEQYEKWKVRELSWNKKYEKYRDEVLTYELYAQQKFSLYNALVFVSYGLVSFFWNLIVVKESVVGSLLCLGVCAFSIVAYIISRTVLTKHIEYASIAVNLYILILGKTLLSIDLIWNEGHGGNISWTLLACSLITTAIISVVPRHYALAIVGVVLLDTIECVTAGWGLVDILYNLLDGVLVAIFCIGINLIFSRHQYAEFGRKEELQFESNRDLLTQLYNRRYIERCFDEKVKPQNMSAIIMLDLDNFKMANDIYGHQKGDEVLCTVSEILRSSFRSDDCVARLGGDEFAVLLPNINCKDAVVGRVHDVLEKFPVVLTGENTAEVKVSVSIGIAFKNNGEEANYTKLCDRADEAMYMAKRMGKGKAVVSAERSTKELVIVA